MPYPHDTRSGRNPHGSVEEPDPVAAPPAPQRGGADDIVAIDLPTPPAVATGLGEARQAAATVAGLNAGPDDAAFQVPPTASAFALFGEASSPTTTEPLDPPGGISTPDVAAEPVDSLGGDSDDANEVDAIARIAILANARGRESAARLAHANAKLAEDTAARDSAMAAFAARLDALENDNHRLRREADAARADLAAASRRADELSELEAVEEYNARRGVVLGIRVGQVCGMQGGRTHRK